MKKKLAAFLLCSFVLISCKDSKMKDEIQEAKSTEKEFFEIYLDLIVKKDDNIHLYYTEDGSLNFTEENSIWKAVKGNDAVQDVYFNLPDNVTPTALRIDLGYGENVGQSPINISSIKITYFDQKVEMMGSDVFNYFYPTAESATRIEGTTQLKKLNESQVVGPILYPNENLILKLQQMTMQSGIAK